LSQLAQFTDGSPLHSYRNFMYLVPRLVNVVTVRHAPRHSARAATRVDPAASARSWRRPGRSRAAGTSSRWIWRKSRPIAEAHSMLHGGLRCAAPPLPSTAPAVDHGVRPAQAVQLAYAHPRARVLVFRKLPDTAFLVLPTRNITYVNRRLLARPQTPVGSWARAQTLRCKHAWQFC
jgi:hypothetical protein